MLTALRPGSTTSLFLRSFFSVVVRAHNAHIYSLYSWMQCLHHTWYANPVSCIFPSKFNQLNDRISRRQREEHRPQKSNTAIPCSTSPFPLPALDGPTSRCRYTNPVASVLFIIFSIRLSTLSIVVLCPNRGKHISRFRICLPKGIRFMLNTASTLHCRRARITTATYCAFVLYLQSA